MVNMAQRLHPGSASTLGAPPSWERRHPGGFSHGKWFLSLEHLGLRLGLSFVFLQFTKGQDFNQSTEREVGILT
jgi:hypothetical protein